MLRDPAADHIEDWFVFGSWEVLESVGNSLKKVVSVSEGSAIR
jgi:hypothetical protein